jgi:thiamine-monophosphate kinase
MRLSELGEFGLLAELERRGLVGDIADDAAQLRGGFVLTQDALVEGIHFRLDWTSWRDLGYKAAAVNLSDLAASGAEPEGLVVTLGAPPETAVEDVLELYAGIAETGVPVVGGDTTHAERLTLAIAAVGCSERVPGRGGAMVGDRLVVTGPLGGSAAGYLCLERGLDHPLVRAHLRPPMRLTEGRRLARHAHAMLDLSDGLAADAAHIAERSGRRLVVELECVPLAPGLAELARALGEDVYRLACGFGEDYELLAAVAEPDAFVEIGRCEEGEGVELRLHGELVQIGGFDHFRVASGA